jgi:hypothetical protein
MWEMRRFSCRFEGRGFEMCPMPFKQSRDETWLGKVSVRIQWQLTPKYFSRNINKLVDYKDLCTIYSPHALCHGQMERSAANHSWYVRQGHAPLKGGTIGGKLRHRGVKNRSDNAPLIEYRPRPEQPYHFLVILVAPNRSHELALILTYQHRILLHLKEYSHWNTVPCLTETESVSLHAIVWTTACSIFQRKLSTQWKLDTSLWRFLRFSRYTKLHRNLYNMSLEFIF